MLRKGGNFGDLGNVKLGIGESTEVIVGKDGVGEDGCDGMDGTKMVMMEW